MHSRVRQPALLAIVLAISAACGESVQPPPDAPPAPPVPETPSEEGSCLGQPTSLDFGQPSLGCGTELRPLRLTNACATSLELELTVVDGELCRFGVSGGKTAQRTVAPGEALMINVALFDEGDFVACEGRVELRDLGSGELLGAVPLTVGRAGLAKRTDEFEGPPPHEMLIVLDDAPSAALHRERVEAELRTLVSSAPSYHRDFRIALIPLSRAMQGLGPLTDLSGSLYLDDQTTADPQASLDERLASLTYEGSEVRQPLEAVSRFFQSSWASQLFREGSTTTVVVVTNGRDQSPREAREYLEELTHSRYVHTAVYALSDEFPGCGGELDDGRLIQWATHWGQLCRPWLFPGNFGFSFGTANAYWLSRPANTEYPIRVFIGDEEFPEMDPGGERNWAYDAVVGGVQFDLSFILLDTMRVEYTALPRSCR